MILLTIISLTALGLSIACIMKTERFQFLYQDETNNFGLQNLDYKNVVKYTDIFNIKSIGTEDDNVYLTNCGNKKPDPGCNEKLTANASYFGPKHTLAGEPSDQQEYQSNKVNN